MLPNIKILPLYINNILMKSSHYKVFYSGRAAGKTHNIARCLLYLGTKANFRMVCARQFQTSIAQSVKTLLDDLIVLYSLQPFYTSFDTKIVGINGTTFTFIGLERNIQEKKGLEAVDFLWIEEGQTLSNLTIKTILPTIRKPGSEVIISMNPILSTDPAYVYFISNPHPDSIVVKTSFLENPFVSAITLRDAAWCKINNPQDFDNIWLGEPLTITDFNIFKNFKIAQATSKELGLCNGPYYGLDLGYSISPNALVEVYINETHRKLYITRELHALGTELDALPDWINLLDIFYKQYIKTDSSRPETISYLNRRGGHCIPTKKGPNSIIEGIEKIKAFDILIDPSCEHTHSNFIRYRFEKDKATGLPKLNKPLDRDNDFIDAIRYAIEDYTLGNLGQTMFLEGNNLLSVGEII